jgi:F0F1-type ATP synthase membrane subunit a
MGLHVFVAFLQAYIFTLLSMIYVGMATEHSDNPA